MAEQAQQLRVFVSHSHQDNEFCHAIVQALRDAGADVWYDEQNLGPGKLHEVILHELDTRPIFVVVLSKAAMASRWVKRETDWAEELRERDPSHVFLPVTASQISRDDFGAQNGWLAYYDYHRIEAHGYTPYPVSEAAARLLQALALTPPGKPSRPVAPQPAENADDLLIRGKALRAQSKSKEALILFERACKLDPKSIDARFMVAYTLDDLGRYDEALSIYDQVLQLDPTDAVIWYDRGITLDNLGRSKEAITSYNRALQLNCNYVAAWFNKGKVLENLGRYVEALVAYDQAIQLDPKDANAWACRGTVLAVLAHYGEALAACDHAVALDSENAIAWNARGTALKGLSRLNEALNAYDNAISINPRYIVPWNNKGLVLARLLRFTDALAAYECALTLDRNNMEAWHNKALSLSVLGRTAEAEEAERRAKELGWQG